MKSIKIRYTHRLIFAIYLIIVLVLFGIIYCKNLIKTDNKYPEIKNGELNLSNWNYNNDGWVKLDGEWEFYWGKLLSPDDFKTNKLQKHFLRLPNTWNNEVIDGQRISKYGYGTYRLRINVSKNQFYALKAPYLYTANKIWVNGDLAASNGKIGKNGKTTVSQYLSEVASFKDNDGVVDIVIQAANFEHRKSSAWSIIFGTQDQILRSRYLNLILEAILFGSTFIMGLYYIALNIKYKDDKSTLFFGMFCLLISIRTILVGERIFCIIHPNNNWAILQKIAYLTFYIGAPLFVRFIHELYPDELPRKLSNFFAVIGAAFSGIVILLNHRIYDLTLTAYEIIIVGMLLSILVALIRATTAGRKSSLVMISGFIFFMACSINDILFDSRIIETSYLLPLGVFGLIFFQSYGLTSRLAYHVEKRYQVEKMLNDALEGDRLKNEFIANVSHEFRTPLNVIFSALQMCEKTIRENSHETPGSRVRDYIGMMRQNCYRLMRLVNNLIDINKIDAGYLKLNKGNYNIVKIVEDITLSVVPFAEQKQINLIFDTDTEERIISCDPDSIERIMLNLLSNAIKFTDRGGNITVAIGDMDKEVSISVEDDGIGIPEDKLNYIFDRFAQVDETLRRNNEGSGIGLSLVKSLVNMHSGKIRAESVYGSGSRFIIELPAVLNKNDINEEEVKKYNNIEKTNIEFSDIYFNE